MWEYVIVALIVGWAGYYLWKTLYRKKGCTCSNKSCTQSNKADSTACCRGQSELKTLSEKSPQSNPKQKKEKKS